MLWTIWLKMETVNRETRRMAFRQEAFLNILRLSKKEISVYLVNGIKLNGALDSFDMHSLILLTDNGMTQMVFKHTISTIMPHELIEVDQYNDR
jgi:host factor-I protein